jgi:hypothetical protein
MTQRIQSEYLKRTVLFFFTKHLMIFYSQEFFKFLKYYDLLACELK